VSKVNRATFAQSLSVSLPVGAYGIAFGAASVAAGFSVLQSCLISLLTFSGASQFALVGVMGSGGTALSATATASLLGTRNLLYGLQMAPVLRTRRMKKVIGKMGAKVCDKGFGTPESASTSSGISSLCSEHSVRKQWVILLPSDSMLRCQQLS